MCFILSTNEALTSHEEGLYQYEPLSFTLIWGKNRMNHIEAIEVTIYHIVESWDYYIHFVNRYSQWRKS